jgi:D-glycero-D-manno-heptose 1,7-bisphosphate phosphatase
VINSRESDCPNLIENSKVIKGVKTLVFDRDGTINIDTGYVHKISEFEFTSEFLQLVPILQKFKGNICITTNQGGVGIGKYSQAESLMFTKYLILAARSHGIDFNLVVSCFHHDLDFCDFRKPSSGMLRLLEYMIKSEPRNYLLIGNDQKDEDVAKDRQVSYVDITSENLESTLAEWINAS